MNDIKLDHFYYYLVIKNGRPLGLLGNDFLHYCKYHHEIGGNIYISEIDIEKYYNSCHKAIYEKEIIDFLDEIIESAEDLERE